MIFTRKFAEGLSDLLRRSRLLYSENRVIIFFVRGCHFVVYVASPSRRGGTADTETLTERALRSNTDNLVDDRRRLAIHVDVNRRDGVVIVDHANRLQMPVPRRHQIPTPLGLIEGQQKRMFIYVLMQHTHL